MRRERSKGGTEGKVSRLQLLNDEFRRFRRQASRYGRTVSKDSESWPRWSAAVDAGLAVAVRISATPAADIGDVAIKFSALLWVIEINESLLDAGDLRRMRALDREVRRLVQARRPVR